MTYFDKIYTEGTTKTGAISYKARKNSELGDSEKALKKTLEAIWETSVDVANNPSHTNNAAKLETYWDHAFDAYSVEETESNHGFDFNFFQGTILMGTLGISIKSGENKMRFVSKATFLKRFIRIADLMSEGKLEVHNHLSDKAAVKMAKAQNEANTAKITDMTKMLVDSWNSAVLNGMMSYSDYTKNMAQIEAKPLTVEEISAAKKAKANA